jgi:hypothetical protein
MARPSTDATRMRSQVNRFKAPLLSLLLTFYAGVAVASVWIARRAAQVPRTSAHAPETPREFSLVIPLKTWEPIFFKAVDERARKAEFPTLRAPLSEGDFEVRVWGGFGLSPLEGFRLGRAGSRWSAAYAGSNFRDGRLEEYTKRLAPPRSGWEGAWARLKALGILELPDAESAGCSTHINDGYSYVVETNVDGVYRTYLYDNPTYSKCVEAKRMLAIASAITDEFELEEFSPYGYLKN